MTQPDDDRSGDECVHIDVEKFSDRSIPDLVGHQLGISIESWVRIEWAIRCGVAGGIASLLALTEDVAQHFPARVLVPIIAVIGTQRTLGMTLLFGLDLFIGGVSSLILASLYSLIIPKYASTYWIGMVINCTLLHTFLKSYPTKRLGLAMQTVSLWFWWKGTGVEPNVNWYFPMELTKTLGLAYCCSVVAVFTCLPLPSFSLRLFNDRFGKALTYCNETYNLITKTASQLQCSSCCQDSVASIDMHIGNLSKYVNKLNSMSRELSAEGLLCNSSCYPLYNNELAMLSRKFKSLTAMRDALPGINRVRKTNNSYHRKQIEYIGASLHSIKTVESFSEGLTKSREHLFSSPDGEKLIKLHGAYKVLTKYIGHFRNDQLTAPNDETSATWFTGLLQLLSKPTLFELREALRASAAVAGSTALSLALDLEPAFWASLTVAFVLSPSTSGSVSTSLNRITGTLCGSMFSYVILRTSERSLIVGLSFGLWSILCGFIKAGNPKYAYGGVVAALTAAIIFFGYDPETGGSTLGHSTIEELAFSRIQQTLLSCCVYIFLMHFYRPVKASILVQKELLKCTKRLKTFLKCGSGVSSMCSDGVRELFESIDLMNLMLLEITDEPSVDMGCHKERPLVAVDELRQVLYVLRAITTTLERLCEPLPASFPHVTKQFGLQGPMTACFTNARKLVSDLCSTLKASSHPSQQLASSASHLQDASLSLGKVFDDSLVDHVRQNEAPIFKNEEAESLHSYVFNIDVLCSDVIKLGEAVRRYHIKQMAGVVVLV